MATRQKRIKREADSTYFLKLVLQLLLGSQWLWLTNADSTSRIPLPLGFVLGLLLIKRERLQLDRKIEYAILLIAMLLGFWFEIGIFIRAL